MELPRVKSFCSMNLHTAGQLFGYVQIFFCSMAILVNLYYRGYLMLPIILMPIAVNICWIYGIREKKPMLMLPAMVPFEFATLACICFITTYPIGIAVFQYCFIKLRQICTSEEVYFDSAGRHSIKNCTSEYFINTEYSANCLAIWIAGCAISSVVVYLTIVCYSVYKSVEEEYERSHLRVPTSDPNQNIGARV